MGQPTPTRLIAAIRKARAGEDPVRIAVDRAREARITWREIAAALELTISGARTTYGHLAPAYAPHRQRLPGVSVEAAANFLGISYGTSAARARKLWGTPAVARVAWGSRTVTRVLDVRALKA